MVAASQRCYLADLGLDSNSVALRGESKDKKAGLELWRPVAEAQKNALQLREDDEIEKYVLSLVRDYFRTTKKAALQADSSFADHGLDSLDAIEFCIQIEDELGYMIEAENLELFKKPKHFINFIKQQEAYKTRFDKPLPHEVPKAEWKFKEAFPGLPSMSFK